MFNFLRTRVSSAKRFCWCQNAVVYIKLSFIAIYREKEWSFLFFCFLADDCLSTRSAVFTCLWLCIQVTLYAMMCSERRREIEAGILLYLKELALQLVPSDHANKRGRYSLSSLLLSVVCLVKGNERCMSIERSVVWELIPFVTNLASYTCLKLL